MASCPAAARTIVWHSRADGNLTSLQTYEGTSWNPALLNQDVFFDRPDDEMVNADARATSPLSLYSSNTRRGMAAT